MKSINNIKGSAILCLAAFIWGLAFVAQTAAVDKVPPFAFNSLRSFIGAASLFIFLKFRSIKTKERIIPLDKRIKKLIFTSSLLCGILLTVSVNFQQAALAAYPKGVASEARGGFITALYVIIVPIISIFSGKRIPFAVLISTLIAMAGIYMLCFSGDVSSIYIGDILMLVCALSFSFHIITVDKFCSFVGGVRLSMLQFLICGLLSGILSLIFELGSFTAADVFSAAPQILYLGIMSSGVAYTLQIVGQKYASAPVASISMSLESVFAALGGWVISGNSLSIKELIGCALVFAAIILAQTPEFFKKATV